MEDRDGPVHTVEWIGTRLRDLRTHATDEQLYHVIVEAPTVLTGDPYVCQVGLGHPSWLQIGRYVPDAGSFNWIV